MSPRVSRAAVVEAGLELIVANRGAAFSMRDVADRLGVAPTAPLGHFVDRAALLSAVAVVGFSRLGGRLAAATAIPDAHARLIAIADAYVAFGCANVGLYRLMFSSPETADEEEEPDLKAASEGAIQLLVDAFAALRAERDRPGNPLHDAVAAWAAMHGIVMLTIDRHTERLSGEDAARRLAHVTAHALVEGVLGLPATAPRLP